MRCLRVEMNITMTHLDSPPEIRASLLQGVHHRSLPGTDGVELVLDFVLAPAVEDAHHDGRLRLGDGCVGLEVEVSHCGIRVAAGAESVSANGTAMLSALRARCYHQGAPNLSACSVKQP